MKKILIIGGGLAGLTTGIQLSRAGVHCTLIEKKSYPFHRVCGEYISNEVSPFLHRNGLFPEHLHPSNIDELQLTSVHGKSAIIPLQMGGFGVSRFALDDFLCKKAMAAGVEVLTNTEAHEIRFDGSRFHVACDGSKVFEADVVIGSFGKRSKLDVFLRRTFISRRSPYTGVKYHMRTDHPGNRISLHNFPGGYCGVSNVENGVTNVCYLTHRDNVRKAGNIKTLESDLLSRNPFLRDVFAHATFLFDKPEVINEISFERKSPVESHMLMVGDSAGMIAPLCGNGMAMAIHGAVLASDVVLKYCSGKISRLEMEREYSDQWQRMFSARLWRGRNLQKLFGNAFLSNVAVNLLLSSRPVANAIVKSTHGSAF